MPQTARVTIPHFPHHVTQRGNRNQRVFFSDRDRKEYLSILKTQLFQAKVRIWAWCLMDNHVHFVAVPETEDGLARCFGETHKRYTRYINLREGWRGYLWQGRFKSFPMDESYLYAAVRYVERNPVEAGMVLRPEDHSWSSARTRVKGSDDPILSRCFLDDEITDWPDFLQKEEDRDKGVIRRHSNIGRPLGNPQFLERLEKITGRRLTAGKPGRPKLQKIGMCT
jgi:putative transposase